MSIRHADVASRPAPLFFRLRAQSAIFRFEDDAPGPVEGDHSPIRGWNQANGHYLCGYDQKRHRVLPKRIVLLCCSIAEL
jgi:hypothetical protein